MKRLLLAVLAGMFIAVLPLQVQAEATSGVVRENNGVWLVNRACEGDACVGDLLTCAEGQNLGTTLSTITFWQGVCDDRDPMQACNGKLTQLFEACTTPEDSTYRGSLIAARSRGIGRVCFDDAGASDCSDPLPGNTVVVTEFAAQGQARSVFLVPPQRTTGGGVVFTTLQGTARIVVTATQPFTFNGKTVDTQPALLTNYSSQQADVDGDSCTAVNAEINQPPGCGFAASAVAESGSGCCGDCNGDGEVAINELVTGVNNGLTGCPER